MWSLKPNIRRERRPFDLGFLLAFVGLGVVGAAVVVGNWSIGLATDRWYAARRLPGHRYVLSVLPFEPWAARIVPQASPEQRLAELGVELPEPLPVVGGYRLTKRHGDTVYVAGHVSATPDRTGLITGKVGDSLSLEQAREAARACALYLLASLRAELGSLDRVTSILKVFGMVNVAPGFGDLAKVLDGCTDLLTKVFGDQAGTPARVAVGVAELPLGAAVEIEMVAAVSH